MIRTKVASAMVVAAMMVSIPALACQTTLDAMAQLSVLQAEATSYNGSTEQQAAISNILERAVLRAQAANARRNDLAACKAVEQAAEQIRPMLAR